MSEFYGIPKLIIIWTGWLALEHTFRAREHTSEIICVFFHQTMAVIVVAVIFIVAVVQ